jgi:hypothetical protein
MRVLKITMPPVLLYWSKAPLPHCRELLVDSLENPIVDPIVDLLREVKLRDIKAPAAELEKWLVRLVGAYPLDNRLQTSWQSCIRE